MVRRMVTLRGREYVMPRCWHSFTSYLSCIATGSPHLLQKVGVFLLNVPHLWQITSPVWYGLVTPEAPQLRQVARRRCKHFRLPQLYSQLPIEKVPNYGCGLSRRCFISNTDMNTAVSPASSP